MPAAGNGHVHLDHVEIRRQGKLDVLRPETPVADGEEVELKLVEGVYAEPGSTIEAIIDLTPGDWAAGVDLENEDGSTTSLAKPFTVTGAFPDVTDPAADVEVTGIDLSFEMPVTP